MPNRYFSISWNMRKLHLINATGKKSSIQINYTKVLIMTISLMLIGIFLMAIQKLKICFMKLKEIYNKIHLIVKSISSHTGSKSHGIMQKIKNVKFTYIDKKYQIGPIVDFCPELEVKQADYDCIVSAIQQLYPNCTEIKLQSFVNP